MPFEMQSRNVGGKTVAKELESRSVFPGGVGGWVSHTTHKYKYKYKYKELERRSVLPQSVGGCR